MSFSTLMATQNEGLLSLLSAASALSPVKTHIPAFGATDANDDEEQENIRLPTAPRKKVVKAKRRRTTHKEANVLEGFFRLNPAPTFEEREEIARVMNMTERKIQVWFQNRRTRERKINPDLKKWTHKHAKKGAIEMPIRVVARESLAQKQSQPVFRPVLVQTHRYPYAMPPPELDQASLSSEQTPPSSPHRSRFEEIVESHCVAKKATDPVSIKMEREESFQAPPAPVNLRGKACGPSFPSALYSINCRNAVNNKFYDYETLHGLDGESSTVMKVRALRKKGHEERVALKEQKSAVSIRYRELKKREIKALKLRDYKFADDRLQKEFGGLLMEGSEILREEIMDLSDDDLEDERKKGKWVKPNLDIASGIFEAGLAMFPPQITIHSAESEATLPPSPPRSTASERAPVSKSTKAPMVRAKSWCGTRTTPPLHSISTRIVNVRGMGRTIAPSTFMFSRPHELSLTLSPNGRAEVNQLSLSSAPQLKRVESLLEKMDGSDPILEADLAQISLKNSVRRKNLNLESISAREEAFLRTCKKEGKVVDRERMPELKRKREELREDVTSNERTAKVRTVQLASTSPVSVPSACELAPTFLPRTCSISVDQPSRIKRLAPGPNSKEPKPKPSSNLRRTQSLIPARTPSVYLPSSSQETAGDSSFESSFKYARLFESHGSTQSDTSVEMEAEGDTDVDPAEEKRKENEGRDEEALKPSLTREECASILLEFGFQR
ncbi:hypothetical protein BT69DRAFT_1316673 [Atractiella rhizophila]|nr:hypothetical protein BT69DRAFT_1316673 [Atractiella rhizophila]